MYPFEAGWNVKRWNTESDTLTSIYTYIDIYAHVHTQGPSAMSDQAKGVVLQLRQLLSKYSDLKDVCGGGGGLGTWSRLV